MIMEASLPKEGVLKCVNTEIRTPQVEYVFLDIE